MTNLANASSGFVSSDIAQIVRNAHLIALKQARTTREAGVAEVEAETEEAKVT